MPAPFRSSGPGEAWVWGDYVMLLQTEPGQVVDLLNEMAGHPTASPSALNYPFVLSVFYRKDRNPHGPSSQPIFVVALENMDYGAVAAMMKARDLDVGELGLDGGSVAPMVGVFTARHRLNLGSYDGALTTDAVRQHLMAVAQQHLSPVGTAVKIGAIAAIHGHPQTGWPAQTSREPMMATSARRKRGGCMVFTGGAFVAAAAFLVAMSAWLEWWD